MILLHPTILFRPILAERNLYRPLPLFRRRWGLVIDVGLNTGQVDCGSCWETDKESAHDVYRLVHAKSLATVPNHWGIWLCNN